MKFEVNNPWNVIGVWTVHEHNLFTGYEHTTVHGTRELAMEQIERLIEQYELQGDDKFPDEYSHWVDEKHENVEIQLDDSVLHLDELGVESITKIGD